MGVMFRSQDMDYVQLILQSDACYDAVCELGEWGMVHFKDLNPSVNAFSRTFVKDIRRSEEMERKLRFFASQMEKGGVCDDAGSLLSYECWLKHAAPSFQEIEELDSKLSQLETEVKEMNDNESNLQRNFLELVELQYIVKLTAQYFDEATHRRSVEVSIPHEEASLLAHEEGARGVQLGYVTGVINRDKYPAFERVMWRGTRGNVYMRNVDIDEPLKDPATGEMILKTVFVAFFQGEVLAQKVKRICDGFGATCYPCPESYAERRALAQRVASSIEELQMVLARTEEFRRRVLSDIADNYEEWYVKVRKMKGAFHTMNKFSTDVTSAALIGEGWVPRADLDTLRDRLTKVTERLGNGVPAIVKIISTNETPPTYHITNKFTVGFQNIVDAYGVATYQEVNPALYTIISFPFLFAVMFGDVGHGVLMTLIAAWMVYKEDALMRDKTMGEVFDMMFGGRYIILLMGIFSIYTGIVYNDVFAKNVWLFDSGWKLPTEYFDGGYLLNVTGLTYDENVCPEGCGYTGTPYPIGVDPVWGLSGNKLSFLNSLKMKLSVLLGVIHMGFGVCLTNFNYVHHKHYYGIFLEFIPQIFLLWGIFGYLCGMIVYKWCNVFPSVELPDGTLQPTDPSLLVSLVNMFLKPGSVDYQSKTKLYEGQGNVQLILLLIAGVCVPVLFLGKPLYLKFTHGKKHDYQAIATDEEVADAHENGGHGHGEEEFNFADVIVDHSIHSIEFVLGTVSNTASYLRLWALSLAHAQLAEVLWDMVLKPTFAGNSFTLFFGFGAWAILSLGVLLAMEGMSAFLHALRLHWVEFNNKFYKGEGYLFMPFNYRDVVEGTTDEV